MVNPQDLQFAVCCVLSRRKLNDGDGKGIWASLPRESLSNTPGTKPYDPA